MHQINKNWLTLEIIDLIISSKVKIQLSQEGVPKWTLALDKDGRFHPSAITSALLQSDAFTLDIVTRQPALANQTSKEACGLITGNTVMGSTSRFVKSVDRFDASMGALINGFDALGVSAPPTPETRVALEEIAADWAELKTNLDQVVGSNDVTLALGIDRQFAAINAKFAALIPAYVEASKSGI